ncbi:LuxR C-terminal-related transcriptional regulator [Kitasatospora sp. CM 4170]|uniref:ATP-binding protein n=1 Tax=Kitasatospora aburaviensis TaxID=67265 RepID=A0ABW1ESS1_9ACTN|nr:LuxR C-terminal-related transcriptional regulator [Kitasatospora sp. CM 4170]WNM44081.1 LuxR C-terminal-related transcriptional regulator [Kitasatospora sp. CM 4170]
MIGKLPAEVTAFVGRRHEVAEVKRLLSASRLVTLTGPGGVGKTRLALRVAGELRRVHRDGVWLVELGELRDPALLAQTVADTLGLRTATAQPAHAAVETCLRDRRLLLVLDNCEHLVEACAALVDRLLRGCPELRVLATARQSLGAAGEVRVPVPPLPVPGTTDPGAVAGSDAVRLFFDRAAAVLPGFAPETADTAAVARLCRRLEGIPLAVELAAAWLRSLTVEQIEARLDERYRLLSLGRRTAPARQQTLRALIDWSHDLCTGPERLLWARLSVFYGGIDLAAAEHVCAGDGLDPGEALRLLDSLVDKSIVTREEHRGRVRYRMLETLREYGEELLVAAGDRRRVRRRHRDWYERLAARFAAEWMGPDQAAWVATWDAEYPNLRAALEFCADEPGEALAGLRLAVGLDEYWAMGGHHSEARRWLDRLLSASSGPSRERVAGLRLSGSYAIWQGDVGPALRLLTEAAHSAAELGDRAEIAYTTHLPGMAALLEGDAHRAAALLGEALNRMRAAKALQHEVNTGLFLGVALILAGDLARARHVLDECLAWLSRRGEVWWRALGLTLIAHVEAAGGRPEQAEAAAREALRCHRRLDSRPGLAFALETLAALAGVRAEHDRAAVLAGAAEGLWHGIGAGPESYFPVFRPRRDYLPRARTALGEAAFEQAARAGRDMPVGAAVAFALEESAQPPSASKAAAVRSPLTRRQWEVAELVTLGLTNQEIAARLVLSRRTAETHVEHILTRLGFTSRAQIAAWVTERRPAASPDA